jgi:hypothetical protein
MGLAASLTKPCCEIIPGQAATSLSQTGGESYSVVKDFNWKGLITFDEASSYVTGSKEEEDGTHNTLATSTIRNLNVANMVQADLVVARITSKHEQGKPEGEITFAGSMIRNLTIAGEAVNVVLDPTPFSQHPTFSDFVNHCRENSGTANAQVREDTATASLVSGEVGCKAGSTLNGYVVAIPEFGKIYVAQVLMRRGYRLLSMLRFELGCPLAGSLEACGGGTNGGDYFP